MSERTRIASRTDPAEAARTSMPRECAALSRACWMSTARRAASGTSPFRSSPSRAADVSLIGKPCSTALEYRRPLLGERGHALGVIRRSSQFALQVALDIELLFHGSIPAAIDGLFGGGKSPGGSRCKLPRQRIHCRGQLRIVHALPDHAPRGRLFGRQLLA